jgi:hypothetical protein
MKLNKLVITSTITATILFTACSATKSQINTPKEDNYKEIKLEAKKAILTVGGTLKKTLGQKAKEGGIPKAAEFCSTNATILTKELSKTLPEGVKLKRITDKPRNSINQANAEQLEVFNKIKTKIAKGEKVDMLVEQKSKNHYQVYKPIMIKAKCLNCHGDKNKRNPKGYDIISKKYPNDKAINYKLNDFRGTFLVDIIK